MTEDRLCGLAMIHVHRNDTVGQVIPEAVLKRRDSSGNRKIHLAFTDLVLSFEIIKSVNARWININHRQLTHAIFSHCCSTPSPEATKSQERPVTYIQAPTDNVRSSFKIT
jgi:hypothetical protein